MIFFFQEVEVTKSIEAKSGQILFRLIRVTPASSGFYVCEVQTKDPAYRYSSLKEMIVPDSSPRMEKIVAHPSSQKENIVTEPSPQIDAEAPKPNTAYRSSQNSAVAIAVCAFIALSINYIARAATFLE